MIERKNYGLTPLRESGKEKFISGAADFGTADFGTARCGHGFHYRPQLLLFFTSVHPFSPKWI